MKIVACPKVSPARPQRLAGGVFACLVTCGTLNFVFVSDNHLGYLIIIPLAFFAVLGDLVESVLKRVHGKGFRIHSARSRGCWIVLIRLFS